MGANQNLGSKHTRLYTRAAQKITPLSFCRVAYVLSYKNMYNITKVTQGK